MQLAICRTNRRTGDSVSVDHGHAYEIGFCWRSCERLTRASTVRDAVEPNPMELSARASDALGAHSGTSDALSTDSGSSNALRALSGAGNALSADPGPRDALRVD